MLPGSWVRIVLFSVTFVLGAAFFCFADNSSNTVNLDVRDAELRDVFSLLANKAKINVLISPKVRGTITCRIDQMDARELIEFIARANCLSIEDHGRILLILAESLPPTKIRVEVVPLMNADSAEVAKMIEKLKLDPKTRVTHDARTNRLIIVHDE